MFANRIWDSIPISVVRRSICLNPIVQKKKELNPEEQLIVHKTNQRSTNKKTFLEKRIKKKPTVWGIVDVYRFITVEKLASVLNKSIGNYWLHETQKRIP